ncbi:hypothetical protein BC835DRAFT_1331864 [Cytidiella melzeri]|nr:hypothetical protein BC835DRAFT_1331864 [Cytidiella melzeri]
MASMASLQDTAMPDAHADVGGLGHGLVPSESATVEFIHDTPSSNTFVIIAKVCYKDVRNNTGAARLDAAFRLRRFFCHLTLTELPPPLAPLFFKDGSGEKYEVRREEELAAICDERPDLDHDPDGNEGLGHVLSYACNRDPVQGRAECITDNAQERAEARLLANAFTRQSEGQALDRLRSALDTLEKLYVDTEHYGRSLPIVQSSGTGKSKLVKDLARRVALISVCLRQGKSPFGGWPPGDLPVWQFLIEEIGYEAEVRFAAWLGAVYHLLSIHLESCPLGASPEQLTGCFPDTYEFNTTSLPSARFKAFDAVSRHAREMLKTNSTQLATAFRNAEKSQNQHLDEDLLDDVYVMFCLKPALKVSQQLLDRQHTRLIIAFDECCSLNVSEASRNPMSLLPIWRVTKAADRHFSKNDLFHFWHFFMDTNLSVSSLVPPSGRLAPSARLVQTLTPLPPFTFLGFDQMSGKPSSTPKGALCLSKVKLMGRPLWSTIPNMTIMETAKWKLFSHTKMLHMEKDHVFAAFALRLSLDIAETAVASTLATDAVKSHMRILVNVYQQKFVVTSAPSEPILALAAADALNARIPSGDSVMDVDEYTLNPAYQEAVGTLFDKLVVSGLVVDKGGNGELIARLLLTLSRDRAIMQQHNCLISGDYLVHTVSLHEFLCTLLPPNIFAQHADFVKHAKKKHLNFTHFVTLKCNIHDLGIKLLRNAWERGVAFQCCLNQPVVDLVLVTYSGSLSEPWNDDKFGTVAIQVKNRGQAASAELVRSLAGPTIDHGKRPVNEVVLFMDLGTSSAFQPSKIRPSSSGNPRIDITYQPALVARSANDASSWAGYLAQSSEPDRWCINVRGSGVDVYPVWGPLEGRVIEVLSALRKVEPIYAAEYAQQLEELKCGLDESDMY